MRVALMPSAYPPALGGVEEMSRNLAAGLATAGDVVEVWAPKVPAVGRPSLEELDGVRVRRLPYALPTASPTALWSFARPAASTLWTLRHAARALRPDVVNVQCFGPNGVYGVALAALLRIPLVVTLHGETVTNDHDVFARSTVLRRSLTVAMRRADAVTGVSRFALADATARFGLDEGRAEVIFNGIELAASAGDAPVMSDALRAEWPDGPVVLSAGRVVRNKGFDLLLEAFAPVAARRPGVAVVIAGDGPALEDLRRQATVAGIGDRVRFPGRLGHADLEAAMAAAAVYVMPSRLESFGIVILEAWRAGRPVIASSRGGAGEFVTDGVDGLLVDPVDVASLGGALERALDDLDLRRRLAAAGARRVQDFGWPEVTERYRAVYRRVRATRS